MKRRHRAYCQNYYEDIGCENVIRMPEIPIDGYTDEHKCTGCGGEFEIEQIVEPPQPQVVERHYGESGTLTWVYDPYITDDDIMLSLEEHGWPASEGTFCQHSYDCCGHRYWSRAFIVRTMVATFVRMSHSMNV